MRSPESQALKEITGPYPEVEQQQTSHKDAIRLGIQIELYHYRIKIPESLSFIPIGYFKISSYWSLNLWKTVKFQSNFIEAPLSGAHRKYNTQLEANRTLARLLPRGAQNDVT